MSLKEKLLEKFHREVIKIDVNGEEIYMKKVGFLVKDWQRVYPPVNEDGTWNKRNLLFGSKQGFIRSTMYIVLAALVFFAFYEYTHNLTSFMNQPAIKACIENLGYVIK